MSYQLPKSTELWKEIESNTNPSDLYAKRDSLKREISSKKNDLKTCESMDQYRAILAEIRAMEDEQIELEIELNIFNKRAVKVRESLTQKIPETYNQEFKPYYDKYVKLEKDLNKKLKNFANDIEPLLDEMKKIEQLEQSYHMLKTKAINEHGKCLKLTIDKRSVGQTYSLVSGMEYGLVSELNRIVKKLKRFL